MNDVADGVIGILQHIALQRGIALLKELPNRRVLIPMNRMVLRQMLISVLNYVLQRTHSGRLVLSCVQREDILVVKVSYWGDGTGIATDAALDAQSVVEHLGLSDQLRQSLGNALQAEHGSGHLVISLSLPLRRRSLLIIDDNADLAELVARYLADQDYEVIRALEVSDGLALAQSARPSVILLDIMMPRQDGWDALQALKHHPSTQDIPVLVCTVLGECELALDLGAAAFLKKPLTRPSLLAALSRLVDRPPPPAVNRRELEAMRRREL